MNKDIVKWLLYLLLFALLQYWQLTQLIKDGEINKTACFWIVVDTIFIACAVATLIACAVAKLTIG